MFMKGKKYTLWVDLTWFDPFFGDPRKGFYFKQSCHRSGNGQGKYKFFKVREKSGSFILSQGKLNYNFIFH